MASPIGPAAHFLGHRSQSAGSAADGQREGDPGAHFASVDAYAPAVTTCQSATPKASAPIMLRRAVDQRRLLVMFRFTPTDGLRFPYSSSSAFA